MDQQAHVGLIVMSVVRKTLTLDTIAFEEDLIDSGQLDSMSLVQLMLSLEDAFNIRIEPEELDFEDYRSVKTMTEIMTRLTQHSPLNVRNSG